jgi:VCBS repeat-containing protein
MNTAHDEFAAGKTYTDSITVKTTDGASKLVTVTINGTDDATVIQGVSTATLTETNSIQAVTGKLTATDVDGSAVFVAQTAAKGSAGFGTFNLGTDGTWSYSMSTAHDEFKAGTTYTDTYLAKTVDGSSKLVTITINGTNDAAIISGVSTSAITESNVVQTATGTLTATDVDSTSNGNNHL